MTQNKIKQILDLLNTLQEHLLSLPDDMLLSIDPRDNDSLDQGTQFIKEYNNNLAKLTSSAANIEAQIKLHFDINPEEEEIEQESENRQKRDRIIKELDKSAPHSLEENFTYKRPYGFVLRKSAYKGLKTWKSMYLHILNLMQKKNPEKFALLPNEDKFISKKGNSLFSKSKKDLRIAEKHPSGFYIEINLSANHIRNNIKDLLHHFDINPEELKIYFREDRDAEVYNK